MTVITHCVCVCVWQTMPTDMRALQDFEEEDKLQIKMNDVITIIEGRSVGGNFFCSDIPKEFLAFGFTAVVTVLLPLITVI